MFFVWLFFDIDIPLYATFMIPVVGRAASRLSSTRIGSLVANCYFLRLTSFNILVLWDLGRNRYPRRYILRDPTNRPCRPTELSHSLSHGLPGFRRHATRYSASDSRPKVFPSHRFVLCPIILVCSLEFFILQTHKYYLSVVQ